MVIPRSRSSGALSIESKRAELDVRIVLLQYLGDGRRQRRLAMIDVPDRPNVYVRLAAIKFLFRHNLLSALVVPVKFVELLTQRQHPPPPASSNKIRASAPGRSPEAHRTAAAPSCRLRRASRPTAPATSRASTRWKSRIGTFLRCSSRRKLSTAAAAKILAIADRKLLKLVQLFDRECQPAETARVLLTASIVVFTDRKANCPRQAGHSA